MTNHWPHRAIPITDEMIEDWVRRFPERRIIMNLTGYATLHVERLERKLDELEARISLLEDKWISFLTPNEAKLGGESPGRERQCLTPTQT
jgi:hypothetical protein